VIPFDFITEWRKQAPWVQDSQVEQDLIVSRALVELFSHAEIRKAFAFRGGTALYKLHLAPAVRYSEDIDLVQITAGPIGPALNAIRDALDSWLGKPKRAFNEGRVTLIYRMRSEGQPSLPMRLKVEINSREHFSVYGIEEFGFEVKSRWFSGIASINTYQLDELLGTKLRALYQRKKGRDLFDLWFAQHRSDVSAKRVVDCFLHYIEQSGLHISRAEFERNINKKLSDPRFLGDIAPLLAPGVLWNAETANKYLLEELAPLMPKRIKNRLTHDQE